MPNIVEAKNLSICYEKGQNIISDATFNIGTRDFVFITGKSGSGKSTLIKALYGAMAPSSGHLSVCSKKLNGISNSKLADLRQRLGLIFQDFRLIDEWNIERNVMLPLIIRGFNKEVSSKQAQKMLKIVNLLHKADSYPPQLSGGEQQRVAVARALAHNPLLFLCDEPTGSLDEYSSDIIWRLLRSAREELNACVIVVTHRIPSNIRIEYRHFEISQGRVIELS